LYAWLVDMINLLAFRLPEPGRSVSVVWKQRPPNKELLPKAQTVQLPPMKLDLPAGQAVHDTPPGTLDLPAGQRMHVPFEDVLPVD